jgi:hypothetical protein
VKDINEKLLKFEEEFEIIKGKREKFHLIYVAAFFLITLAALYFFQKYYSGNTVIRYIFFIFIISGLIVHYILRYSFHRSKNRYKKYFTKILASLQEEIKDTEKLNAAVIDAARTVFKSRNMELNTMNLKHFVFWELLLLNLKINV